MQSSLLLQVLVLFGCTIIIAPADAADFNIENNGTCDIYKDWRRNSKGFLIRGYEGIPQNLVLNVCGVVIMVLLFSVLRKKAWNYGRIAFVNDTKWTNILYGGTSDDAFGAHSSTGVVVDHITKGRPSVDGEAGDLSDPSIHEDLGRRRRGGGGTYNDNLPVLNESSPDINGPYIRPFRQPTGPVPRVHDDGYFTWIKTTYQLTDDQFLSKSGPDAVQYLSYQRHLIFLASIITLSSLIIILPLNLQGSKDYDGIPDISVFEQSTIFNLGSDSKLLWIHEMLAIAFLCLSIAVMRHFSRSVKFVEEDISMRRTVQISGISKTHCNDGKLRGHFETLYSGCKIKEINFAYDVTKLVECENEKAGVVTSRKYWEEHMTRTVKRPTMRPFTCGHLCCCCCCIFKETDALDYYMDLENRLRKQADLERTRALSRPLGIAFVTFATVAMAECVVSDYRLTARFLKQTPTTKFSRRLTSRSWIVTFAPQPQDLYWENLSLSYKAWYFRAILINMTLILIVCFYSTPVFLLNVLNAYLEITKKNNNNGTNVTDIDDEPRTFDGVLRDTLPTFLLWVAAVTLPSLVSLSDRFVGFWTKTSENRSKMIKTFTFLLFMVIILPSLGLTSAASLVNTKDIKWRCIFSPTNGSFFVNYVITSCFLGTMSELMRLPELFVYAFKLCFAKSAADTGAIRKSVLWDFQLGSQYAWMMLIFAIFILFSLVTPVITIFGFVYLLFKHYVDRYNIYFAYAPTKVDKEVHGTAINFVVVCTFLQQMILVAYTNSNYSKPVGDLVSPVFRPNSHHSNSITSPSSSEQINKPLQAFTILGFCITAALFIGQVFFNMCANFSPILYNRLPDSEARKNAEQQMRLQVEPSSSDDDDFENYSYRYRRTRLPRIHTNRIQNQSSDLITIVSPPKFQTSMDAIDEGAETRPTSPNNIIITEQPKASTEATEQDQLNPPDKDKEDEDEIGALNNNNNNTSNGGLQIPSAPNLYRPGIDKPYGHYFPNVLRLDYDKASTLAFNEIYHPPPEPPVAKKKVTKKAREELRRNELLILRHNSHDAEGSIKIEFGEDGLPFGETAPSLHAMQSLNNSPQLELSTTSSSIQLDMEDEENKEDQVDDDDEDEDDEDADDDDEENDDDDNEDDDDDDYDDDDEIEFADNVIESIDSSPGTPGTGSSSPQPGPSSASPRPGTSGSTSPRPGPSGSSPRPNKT